MKHHIHKSIVGATTFVVGVLVAALTVRELSVSAEELLFLIGGVWLWFLLPAIILSLPVWFFGRHRANWLLWELSILVLPYWFWCVLMMWDGTGKSIANLFAEPLQIGCFIPVAALIRVAAGHKANRMFLASGLILGSCLVAALVYFFMPILPE